MDNTPALSISSFWVCGLLFTFASSWRASSVHGKLSSNNLSSKYVISALTTIHCKTLRVYSFAVGEIVLVISAEVISRSRKTWTETLCSPNVCFFSHQDNLAKVYKCADSLSLMEHYSWLYRQKMLMPTSDCKEVPIDEDKWLGMCLANTVKNYLTSTLKEKSMKSRS